MNLSADLSREFIVLAQRLNFTKAARTLNMAQSSLSRHVAAVEAELGLPLFRRLGTTLELTDGGVRFLQACNVIVETHDAMLADMRALRSRPSYNLTIVGPFFIDPFLALVNACTSAIRSDRGLECNLIMEPALPYLDMLRAGKAYVVFTSYSPNVGTSDLECLPVGHWQLWVAVRLDHPLARSTRDIAFSELNGMGIHSLEGISFHGWRQTLQDLCNVHGVHMEQHVRRGSTLDVRLDEVGGDVAILCDGALDIAERAGLVYRRIADEDCYFDIRAYWRKDTRNPAVSEFIEHLRRFVDALPETADEP
jgi:DNA-binding transcriptional LysR family regulator